MDKDTFTEESKKLIKANITVHDANVLLRSDPPKPGEAIDNIVDAIKTLINLISEILIKKMDDVEVLIKANVSFEIGEKENEHNASPGDNEAKSNDDSRS